MATAAVDALLTNKLHRWTTLWKIVRADNTTFYFTDHDGTIDFEQNTYTPVGGFGKTATEQRKDLDTTNTEIRGVLTSGAITHDDLRAGRWREAEITEYVVDWRTPWAGAIKTTSFWVADTTFNGEFWTAQIEGLERWLRHPVGDVVSQLCRYTLADIDCTVPLGSYQETGTVSSISTARRIFIATGPTKADAYYTYGKIVWTNGNNAGLTSEIKTYTLSPLQIEFQLATPFDIEVGDTFIISAGCDKQASTCKTKFNNLVNFGGQPFIPGSDRAVQSARGALRIS